MKIQITAEGMDLTDSIKNLINKKLGKDLNKYLLDIKEGLKIADVVVRHNIHSGFSATFNIALPTHKHLFAKSEAKDKSEDIETIIVRLREEMEREIAKYKEKLNRGKI